MNEQWLKDHLDELEPEEMEILGKNTTSIKTSALAGFILGLFPQYTLLSHPFLKNHIQNGFKAKIGLALALPIPLVFSMITSSYFYSIQEDFISQLRLKYPQAPSAE